MCSIDALLHCFHIFRKRISFLKEERFLKKLFIAALFTIARIWKQCRYPSTDEWVKKCGTYTMEY